MANKVTICSLDTTLLPKLKQNEIRDLLVRLKNGEEKVREQLIIGNLRLVLSVLQKYWAHKALTDDLFQIGCLGLIKAIDNFDLKHNVRFSTYAVPMIIGEIRRYLRDTNSLRVARSIRDTAYKVLKTREELERTGSEEVGLEDISKRLNLPLSEVACALDAVSAPISLYEPVFGANGDEILLVDQLYDEKQTGEIMDEHIALEAAMEKLGERERKILYLRYYKGHTQTEISHEVGISQAQVSRLEKAALSDIRAYIS